MTAAPPRSAPQRKQDTLDKLNQEVDAWVASAGDGGRPYLVPLSYLWDGAAFTVATPESSPTGRNLRASGRARLALGPTRDVVVIDGLVEAFTLETVPADVADTFAVKLWDPRKNTVRYAYFRITPRRIQAWREENELAGRELMRDGTWLI